LNLNPSKSPEVSKLHVSGNTLNQVEKFMYLGLVFMSDRKQNRKIDAWITITNSVLHKLYRIIVIRQKLSNTSMLSVFKLVYVPILTYGHESCVMTEIVIFQVQAADIGYLPTVHSMTIHNKVRSCKICKVLNVDLLLQIEIPATMIWLRDQNSSGKKCNFCWLHPQESDSEVEQRLHSVITSLTFFVLSC